MAMVRCKFCTFRESIEEVLQNINRNMPMGDRTRNGLSPALLFTGLGCFAWFLLAGYTDLTPSAEAVLGSGWVCLVLVVLFNALGFLTLRVSAWLNR